MTRRHCLLALFLTCLAVAQARAAPGPALDILTEDDPPLTFEQDGKAAGLVVEVVQGIQRRVGNRDPIAVVPWARGYRQAQQQPNTVLFNTNRTPERERMFKWVGPVTETLGCLFVRRDSPIKLQTLDDARKLPQIMVVRDWYLQQLLSAQNFSNLATVATPDQLLNMLMRKRADVIVSENTTLPHQLRQQGFDPSQVRKALTFSHTYGYIAFSRQTPDAVIKAWQQALDEMKRDGSFAALYRRWLPGEAPPGINPPSP
ncbi:polar amino acid transport system substrate-binding protein [Chromobacterium alkanivorans]|uniref:substrate-binding periplasmic protein n=1 Tax=Chromobacterium TaxID=535 RepID=UPI0009E415F5|nr:MULTISPECIES: ABC transporter substrate-binding protein [Chromobacterium]MCS3806303.1 polar amino acid transport system substrate-binding protein [Chromobacterium alkanivorans]MCS3820685.1 polar amino acid transport system substrate-binding protein [Chromobacterium alkanivorans]MCS3875443.1 polar amino acid transport system substrate-binding protein [Chromobacterium alkanivorans]